MSTATLEAKHTLRGQLAAENIDQPNGIIIGATVAKAGVQATGKFVMLDANGRVTNDDTLAKSEVPVFTDEKTLTTLMAAAKVAGKRVKVREDHVDEPGARAGYSYEFKMTDDGRVITNIQLFKSYGKRELMLETAKETPEEIGLSIDFIPEFELRDGKAFIRVSELNAVDIVDEGAITPGGLFLSASVDTGRKVETEKISTPATMAAPTTEELMPAISALTTSLSALAKTVTENQAALAKLTAASATPAAPAPDANAIAALAAVNELKTQFAAQQQQLVQMKKEKALLGFRGSSEERAKLASATVEEIETAAKTKKDYLALVAERAASGKMSRAAANRAVRETQEGRDAYSAYIAGLNNGAGIYRKERMAMAN